MATHTKINDSNLVAAKVKLDTEFDTILKSLQRREREIDFEKDNLAKLQKDLRNKEAEITLMNKNVEAKLAVLREQEKKVITWLDSQGSSMFTRKFPLLCFRPSKTECWRKRN